MIQRRRIIIPVFFVTRYLTHSIDLYVNFLQTQIYFSNMVNTSGTLQYHTLLFLPSIIYSQTEKRFK
jgi:hypothetical protein